MLDAKTNENIEVLNYSTTNKKLDVKWFQQYSNGSMKALLSKSNFLYSYEKRDFYGKEDEFSVVSWQKILGQDTLRVFSKVEFLYLDVKPRLKVVAQVCRQRTPLRVKHE
ncbi:MAG: hypothetical protein R2836_07260 [Chitinophagales bacterium]